jgi:hypothetical protein
MSPSTKSKSESPTLPETGDAPDSAETAAEAPKSKDKKGGTVEVGLEIARQRPIGWTIFGIVVGALLVWKLGTVGKWVGVVLMAIGAYRGYQLALTFIHPPGKIKVTDTEVTLPRGLCMPRPLKVKPTDVTAVYFLRRSVPWNHSAPVLVVELGTKAIAYPRDWFSSEADQRHLVHALLRHRPEKAESEA